jgi:hypothetical protein
MEAIMNTILGIRRRLAIIGALAALLGSGCATVPPTAAQFVHPPIGTTWTQSITSTGSFGSGTTRVTITRGERAWNGARLVSLDSAQGSLLMTERGALVAYVAGDKPVRSWDPPHTWNWPLEVGKRSVHGHRFHDYVKGVVEPYVASDTVEAYEDVTVPAGTFKAFRIRSEEDNGFHSVTWFVPTLGFHVKQRRVRSAASHNGPGTQEMEVVALSVAK